MKNRQGFCGKIYGIVVEIIQKKIQSDKLFFFKSQYEKIISPNFSFNSSVKRGKAVMLNYFFILLVKNKYAWIFFLLREDTGTS
jgi:hypothetical protein